MVNKFLKSRVLSLLIIFISMAMIYYGHSNGETKVVLDKDKCINCGKCKKVCQMNIDPVENCNHLECIRCGRCKNACPVDAISYGVRK